MKDYYPGILEAAKAVSTIMKSGCNPLRWCETIIAINEIENTGTRKELIDSVNRMCEKGKVTIVTEHGENDSMENYTLEDVNNLYKKIVTAVKQ